MRLLTRLNPHVVFTPGWSMLESLLAIEWCVAQNVPFVIMSESTRADFSRTSLKEAIEAPPYELGSDSFRRRKLTSGIC